jgi:Protein of unknown function (DUF3619)
MNNENHMLSPHNDQFGRRLSFYLTESADNLPYEITERLRAARARALARRQTVSVFAPVQPQVHANGTLALGGAPAGGNRWWSRIGFIAPLVALVAGFALIQLVQDELRTSELAEIDAELLADELPPQAFTDPGFVQYLRTRQVP